MKSILALVLIAICQVAVGQNFMLTADGTPVQDNDTIVKTIAGNGGWYTEVTDIEIENISSQDLIINIIQDDANVVLPAFVYIGCGAFGCIPPGVNNPIIDLQVNAGVTTHLTSPAFECSGNQCSGSHTASYTVYDQTGQTNGITFFIKYDIPVTVGMAGLASDPVIHIHPNPASNSLTVISGQQFEVIEIYDVIGNLVLKDLLCAPGSCRLDISMLNEGIYFLKAHHGETTSVQRILINR